VETDIEEWYILDFGDLVNGLMYILMIDYPHEMGNSFTHHVQIRRNSGCP